MTLSTSLSFLLLSLVLICALLPHAYADSEKKQPLDASPASPPHSQRQRSNRPVILMPGFASTRLMAWKKKSCALSEMFDIRVGDRVWLDVRQVALQHDPNFVSKRAGWIACASTEPIKLMLRVASYAPVPVLIELDPGAITGALSAIFRACISELATHFDYDNNNLQAMPYDFRLPPPLLESRDHYFSKTKLVFEDIVVRNGEATVVIAHSLGNNILRYFLAWLEHTMGHTESIKWIDKHIWTYFAIGAPLLGSAQSFRCGMSGVSMGLPISEVQGKRMWNSWGATPWMYPFPAPHPSLPYRPGTEEPMPPLVVTWPDGERTYTSEDVLTRRVFKDLARVDPEANLTLGLLDRYYANDPVLEMLKPPERPAIRNVYCVYGINLPTEIGYRYEIVDGYPFSLADVYFEDADGQLYRMPTSTYHRLYGRFTGKRIEYLNVTRNMKSGDGSVPYHSLSWCNTWHGSAEVETHHEERPLGGYVSSWFGVDTGIENIYRFTSSAKDSMAYVSFVVTPLEDDRTLKTEVIEFDNVFHREIIRSPKFLSLLVKELVSEEKLSKVKEKLVNELAGREDRDETTHEIEHQEEEVPVPASEKESEIVTELIYVTEQREKEAHYQGLNPNSDDEYMRKGDTAATEEARHHERAHEADEERNKVLQ